MLSHFLVKEIKGETLIEITGYFEDHFRSTLVAFIVTSIGYLAYISFLAEGTKGDVIAIFMLGYMFDSMLNKWSTKNV